MNIPRNYYLYPPGVEQIHAEHEGHPKVHIDVKRAVEKGWMAQVPTPDGENTVTIFTPQNGLWLPFEGATFPMKGFPALDAVHACNIVKSLFIEPAKLLSKWYFFPFLLMMNAQNALDGFNRTAMKAFSHHLLVPICRTDFSREIEKFLDIFLQEMGFTEDSAKTFALIFSNMVDYDNVYRLRLEDAFSETSQDELINNPREVISKLTKMMKSREVRPGGKGDAIHRKFASVATLFSLALLIPKVKRAFKQAISQVDFPNLQLDEIDTYWVLQRNDYRWLGKEEEERLAIMKEKGWTTPTAIPPEQL